MNKKQIVIIAGVGLICFALSFTVGLFTRENKKPDETGTTAKGAQVVDPLAGTTNPGEQSAALKTIPENSFQVKQANLDKSLTIKQLNSLIFDMRTKITEFSIKEKKLAEKEQRIQMAMDELQKNIKGMEELRVKLAVTVSTIKQQKTILDKRLIQINEIEKNNLIKTAAIYDKMKPQESSEIMINLNKLDQLDYSVKLAYYMTERTSANMIAEINKQDPQLAATISDKLRWIEEVKQ